MSTPAAAGATGAAPDVAPDVFCLTPFHPYYEGTNKTNHAKYFVSDLNSKSIQFQIKQYDQYGDNYGVHQIVADKFAALIESDAALLARRNAGTLVIVLVPSSKVAKGVSNAMLRIGVLLSVRLNACVEPDALASSSVALMVWALVFC